MRRNTYAIGEAIGPSKVLYMGDIPSIRNSKGIFRRRVSLQCPCGAIFVGFLKYAIVGKGMNCGCGINSLRLKPITRDIESKIRKCWAHIKGRCNNTNNKGYPQYGGRGILMYQDWITDYKAFNKYVTSLPGWDNPRLSLDRADNDGNYEPGNLRWATPHTQVHNRRNKNTNLNL